MSNSSRLFLPAGIIVSIIIAGFILSIPHTHDVLQTLPAGNTASTIPVVALRDSFKKGTHTIIGKIEAPNACTSISVDVVPLPGATASTTQAILVALSMPPDAGICLQEPAKISFSGSIEAPAGLPISVTVNGIQASTTPL